MDWEGRTHVPLRRFPLLTVGFAQTMVQVDFPAFSRRGGCAINKKVPFLSGADGAVSNLNKIMCAARFLDNRPALAF